MKEIRYVSESYFNDLINELAEHPAFTDYKPCETVFKCLRPLDASNGIRTLTIDDICYVEEKGKP